MILKISADIFKLLNHINHSLKKVIDIIVELMKI